MAEPRELHAPPSERLARLRADIDRRLDRLERAGPLMAFPPFRFYRPEWSAAGSAPAIGDGELVGWWSACNFWRVARGHIKIGASTDPGSGAWTIGFPVSQQRAATDSYDDEAAGWPHSAQTSVAAVITPDGVVNPCGVYFDRALSTGPPPLPGFEPVGGFQLVPYGTMPHTDTEATPQPHVHAGTFDLPVGTLVQWQVMVHLGPHPVRV